MKNLKINNLTSWVENYQIQDKYIILLILTALYKQGKITKDKFSGQIKALRKGTLLERKRTYHSDINNQWYDHETPTQIFRDYMELLNYPSLSMEALVQSLMLLEEKNKNYAINMLMEEYINPMFRGWYPDGSHSEDFAQFLGVNFPMRLKANISSYDCDCCGSPSKYCDKNTTEIFRELSKYFHDLKNGNLAKIPFHEMGSPYSYDFM